jgi:hypothetical protein
MLHGGSEKRKKSINMIIWLMLVEMLQLLFISDKRQNYLLIIGYHKQQWLCLQRFVLPQTVQISV